MLSLCVRGIGRSYPRALSHTNTNTHARINIQAVAPFSHQFSRVTALKTGLLILLMGGLIFGLMGHVAGFVFGRILQVRAVPWRDVNAGQPSCAQTYIYTYLILI